VVIKIAFSVDLDKNSGSINILCTHTAAGCRKRSYHFQYIRVEQVAAGIPSNDLCCRLHGVLNPGEGFRALPDQTEKSAKATLATTDHNDNHLQPGVKAAEKKGLVLCQERSGVRLRSNLACLQGAALGA
jgi:hypothetical protein